MKIVQLQYFCAVTRLHSITKAAAELYVTQPAISSAIKELEKEFSINLFNRTKNHLTLTKEGELFYQKAVVLNSGGIPIFTVALHCPKSYSCSKVLLYCSKSTTAFW